MESLRMHLIYQLERILELLKDDEVFYKVKSKYGGDYSFYNNSKRAEFKGKLREFRRDSIRLIKIMYNIKED